MHSFPVTYAAHLFRRLTLLAWPSRSWVLPSRPLSPLERTYHRLLVELPGM